ncbi:MFS transporter [Pelagibacterium halotolerans]|uniref:MFS transporter n=1 Tax=Pelagibacterium halotolerans TaxID=531813 RepID=UPI00384BEF28
MTCRQNIISPNFIKEYRVVALFAAVVAVGSNAFILSPILSEVAQGLRTEPFRVAWAISAFGAATALSSFFLSPVSDRVSPHRTLGMAAVLLAIAQVSSGASQNWGWLCASQAVAGTAVGILLPGTYAATAATAPSGREAARLGFVLTGWALSLVLAVPLAAFMTERWGWRVVYAVLAAVSATVAVWLFTALRGTAPRLPGRTSPWQAIRLPGVAFLLAVIFGYMTAFYGTYAFFGEGIRNAFGLSAEGGGVFVLAYGLGFGLAGLGLTMTSPRISPAYVLSILCAIAVVYFAWGFALGDMAVAFGVAMVWGVLNQLGLNALIVLLNRRAERARGAVMGLNSAVTYLAVFAGPVVLGTVYTRSGFTAVTTLAGVLVAVAAVGYWMSRRATR